VDAELIDNLAAFEQAVAQLNFLIDAFEANPDA